MNIPTLTKGFLSSMGPSLGVATLNDQEPPSGPVTVEVGENVHSSDWTSFVPEGDDETN